jgi:predicted dehydrogenase
MAERIRWGILGPGTIARRFAAGLSVLPDAELVAVGSHSPERAEQFGAEFNAPHRHTSYEALANDPDVDAVYVATPHPMHKDNTILCLRAGKAVLCEKPFAVNRGEAEEMVRVAREEKRFLMEAMWTRHVPAIRRARQWLVEGAIGEPRILQVDFGFRATLNPEHRLFAPELAGGALLDVGVYCVSLASMVFGGAPERIASMAHLGETGVDEQAAMLLGYRGGAMAVLYTAVRTETPHEAYILGTEGQIKIHTPFWRTTHVTLTVQGQVVEDIELPYDGTGYNCEADTVGQCLRAGKLECDLMPLDESVSIMGTMDQLRAQWGLRYPME